MCADGPIPTEEIGDALTVELKPDSTVRTTLVGPEGTRKTFYRRSDESPLLLDIDESTQQGVVSRFIRELSNSNVPLMLKTRSNIGDLGEELFLGFNSRQATGSDNADLMNGEVLSVITFCAYAKGNGVMIPEGQYGLIGHRDLVLAQDGAGEFVYTDKKLPVADYYPPAEAGWKLWKGNLSHFENSKTIERWHPEGFDPYNVGIGSMLQGSAVGWFLDYPKANRINTGILFPDGIRMWQKYGLDISSGTFNTSTALKQITQDIFTHIR